MEDRGRNGVRINFQKYLVSEILLFNYWRGDVTVCRDGAARHIAFLTIGANHDVLRADGMFVVADDRRRIGTYAYATSDCATRAESEPEAVALEMVESDASFVGIPSIRVEMYHRASRDLDLIAG